MIVCKTKLISFFIFFVLSAIFFSIGFFALQKISKGIFEYFWITLAPSGLIFGFLSLIFSLFQSKIFVINHQKILLKYRFLPISQVFDWKDLSKHEELHIKTWNGTYRQTNCIFKGQKISIDNQEFDNYEQFRKILLKNGRL